MKRNSPSSRNRQGRDAIDWSGAVRNPHAAALARCRWRVEFDPDLVDLLSGSGDPFAHLAAFVSKRKRKSERLVLVLRMTDKEIRPLRPMLQRIGAKVDLVAPHPNLKLAAAATARRKAG